MGISAPQSRPSLIMPSIITNSTIAKARADAVPGCQPYDITDARAQGLELRVRPRGAMWCIRYKVAGASKRLTAGSINLLSIAEARQIASDAQAVLRAGGELSDQWMTKRLVDLGRLEAVQEPPPPPTGWTFSEGRDAYLTALALIRAPGTVQDYRDILAGKDLRVLDDRVLSTITREELAEILVAIHASGREAHSHHVARVLRPFWTWLSDDGRRNTSGAAKNMLVGLQAPERSVSDDEDEDGHGTYVPEMREMALAIAGAQTGALRPAISSAIELLVWTAQRRRAIVSARMRDFIQLPDGKGLWRVPAASRKKRRRNGKVTLPLVVPLPAPVWRCVVKAAEARTDKESEFLFPAASRTGHLHHSTLTHYLSYLPGVIASPHDMRRGFATHGEAILKLSRSDTKSILDHEEDVVTTRLVTHRTAGPNSDMTGIHYSLHDGTHRTWPIMSAWTQALERELGEVEAQERWLGDVEFVRAEINRNKRKPKDQRNRVEALAWDGTVTAEAKAAGKKAWLPAAE